MFSDILTPLNHREIEYNAAKLPGDTIPGCFVYESIEANELLSWLDSTSDLVFDKDLVMDYGTDCLRLYLLFESTPKENDAPFYESWQEGALEGLYKFIGRYRRMVIASCEWNRLGKYRNISKEVIDKMNNEFDKARIMIDKCIKRGNDMANRHNIVSVLMGLLNILYKEMKIGEIVTLAQKHAVDTAIPHGEDDCEICDNKDDFVDSKSVSAEIFEEKGLHNTQITNICKNFIILIAPLARDTSKLLWQSVN